MARRGIMLFAFDAILLGFLYFVLYDLSWRASYVESEGLTPSYSYSLFTQTFKITGGTVQFPLVSPPTLNWAQVIIALLLVVNCFFLVAKLRRRHHDTSPSGSAAHQTVVS